MFKKTKVRSILELLGKNLSAREVSKVLGVSRNTVAEVQALFLQSGRSWDDISEWDDDRLYGLFYPDKFKYKPRYAPVDYSYVHKELKKTGVTEKLLWEEYCARCEKDGVNACSYITFAKNYKKFTADKNYTSHVEHKPGLEVEVDWSGPSMNYMDPDTGERVTAYLFVATMPYSQMIYVEAATSMNEKAWLSCQPILTISILKFCVVVARQLNVPGDGGVLAAEHEDIKFGVTGKDILHPVPCHMEGKADVPHLVIIRGEGELVCQPVRYGFLQHGGIAAAGVQGI